MSVFIYAVVLLATIWAQESGSVISRTTVSQQIEIVIKHNALRRVVSPSASNMLKMSWSGEAADNAQEWADRCLFLHSYSRNRTISTSSCGENLFFNSYNSSWGVAIQAWYDEKEDHQYGVGAVNGTVVRHYTQVVWYRSSQVGCAMAYCPGTPYRYHYVCHYCPPGNYQLTHPYKSGTTCGDCPNGCEDGLCTKLCQNTDTWWKNGPATTPNSR